MKDATNDHAMAQYTQRDVFDEMLLAFQHTCIKPVHLANRLL